jgi:xanthine dehydrogenase accessory factor
MDSWEQIAKFRREGVDAVVITITAARGSVPGQVGAKAVVTADGMVSGNLGGGKVEAKAAAYAASLLLMDETCVSVTWNLQQDVGMTCGGEMAFLFERLVAREPWHIAIFGAGHVAQALVPVLATLACRIDVFDPRAEWLDKFPAKSNVRLHHVKNYETGVASLTPRSFVISVTQGHSCDRPVLRETLREFPDVPFLGVIGSAAKRAVLKRELLEDGLPGDSIDRIICPLGLPIGGNDPAEIAISVAAQLLEFRQRVLLPNRIP